MMEIMKDILSYYYVIKFQNINLYKMLRTEKLAIYYFADCVIYYFWTKLKRTQIGLSHNLFRYNSRFKID